MNDDELEELFEEPIEEYAPTSQINKPKKKPTDNEQVQNKLKKVGSQMGAAGISTQAAGKTMKAAGKTAEIAGKGAQAAGKGIKAASNAAGSALSAIPYVGTALGGAVKGVGNAAGKGMEMAGKGAEKAGKATNKAGEKTDNAGKRLRENGKNFKELAKQENNGIADRLKGNKLKGAGVIKSKPSLTNANSGVSKQKADPNPLKKPSIVEKAKQAIHPVDAIKEKTKKLLKAVILPKVLIVFLIIIMIALIIESIFEVFEAVNEAGKAVANFHEKLDNYLNGLGFDNSEDAFYNEYNRLNKKVYNKQLDLGSIMATIFYNDIQNGLDPDSDDTVYAMVDAASDEADGSKIKTAWLTVKKMVSNWISESNETVSGEGLVFTSNKIYRLRMLAKHQFANGLFGAKKEGPTQSVSLKGYLKKVGEMLGSDLVNFIKSIPRRILRSLGNIAGVLEDLKNVLIDKEQKFKTTDTANQLLYDSVASSLFGLLKDIFSSFSDVEDVYIGKCVDSLDEIEEEDYIIEEDSDGNKKKTHVCVKYKTYQRDLDSYYEYLRKKYIPSMPEFDSYLDGLSGSDKEEEIEKIIDEIKDLAEGYEEYYGEEEDGSVVTTSSLKGNINPYLLSELQRPVDDKGVTFAFPAPYGYGLKADGTMHDGIDINSITTGNTTGDPVYSVYYSGTVTESTYDKSYVSSDCKENSGCIRISYKAVLTDATHDFTVIYTGLDPSSITLNKGDIIGKGDQIGTIGTAEHSEVGIPSLHYGMYYNTGNEGKFNSDSYMDPTNLYIKPDKPILNGSNTAEKLWKALLQKGFSKEAAAGVLGNAAKESGGNSVDGIKTNSTYNGTYEEIIDSNKGGFGLVGWVFPAFKKSFKDYLNYVGGNWYDEDVQIGYLIETIITTTTGNSLSWQNKIWSNRTIAGELYTYDNFINAKTPEEAAKQFWGIYENSGTYSDIRSNCARDAYNKFKDLPLN